MSRVRFWKQLGFPAVCALGVGMPTAGWAQAQSSRFALEYSVHAQSCPARDAFLRAISARTPSALEVSPGEGVLTLTVRLEKSGDRANGRLNVRRPDGLSSQRDVPEGACAEVAESLAIIVAMLLEQRDFESAPQPSTAGTAQGADAAQSAPVTQAEQAANAPPPPTPPRPRAAEQPPQAPSAAIPSAPVNARAAWGLALTAGTVLESEAAPSFALGLLAGVEGFWERESLWSPSARLAAYQVDAGREIPGYGRASFRLRALRLSLCPLRWLFHRRLSGRGCAALDAGELRARGEVAGGRTLTMPWFAAGASGRLSIELLSFLNLEGEALLQALSRHDEFVFEPNAFSVHSLAPVTLGASLGLTLRAF